METYFTLKEKFANYFFFPLGRGRGMLNVQYNYEDTKGIIRGHNSKDAHNAIDKNNDRYNTPRNY
jgi:hypothetical protein